MSQQYHFTIQEKPPLPLRLDKFLLARIPAPSRSVLQKWIMNGYVRVNDRPVTKHHFLSKGDIVALDIPDEQHAPLLVVDVDVPILFEDADLIVVDKPAGLLAHAVSLHDTTPTLVDVLRLRVPQIVNVGDDPLRPGIVHRLDRAASGVMVVAKTNESFKHLRQQFHDRKVQKEYRAIVHGIPTQEHFVLKFRMAHSARHGGKMAARPEHVNGKDAWTECNILETWHRRYALLAIHIRTGRTHQIRAHLAATDHPIVGDERYTSKHYYSRRTYPRLFLHAFRLTLTHPVKNELTTWTAPLPTSFFDFFSAR